MEAARDTVAPAPDRIAAVSGGALGAAAFVARRGHQSLDAMMRRFAEHDSNLSWDALDPDTGLTKHQRIYREVVEEVITAEAAQAVRDGPPFEVLLGHPPGGAEGGKAAATAATAAYEAELHAINSPHFSWAERLGVTSTRVDARQAARDGRLSDLICAAAVIPPLFDMAWWDGLPVIDGGMVDQAPLPRDAEGPVLILLTRRYKRLPDVAERVYVAPGEETPADKIDFTDPDKIARTWAQGEADARAWLAGAPLI
jgi:predicted acylesterase/phospholipase RssA